MTRKDYVLIAEALKEARAEIRSKEPPECVAALNDGVSYAAEELAFYLYRDNQRFDRERFLRAAGVQS
ncbi:MAG TPA: hypothetical protein VGU20_31210 [Stellaceae bacterium]|nr:hypothetical protein [Terriglobia bacterium]HEV2551821.1 hypothetical protein [Stellaceae bacterium]